MNIIVIGTSTGGLGTLKCLLAGLPADFPAAVLVVMHIGAYDSILPELFKKSRPRCLSAMLRIGKPLSQAL
ncbi:chemotaxis protein CheB [Pseudomonas asuensis]